jgi:DivIVA domain-containing protein
MSLTPADIHNIAFKKTPIGKRGYDAEDVDAFLDELVGELTGLIEDNNQLRAQAERGGGLPGGELAAELDAVRSQLDRAQRERAAAEQAAHAVQAELEQTRGGAGPAVASDADQQVTRVLMMAQRTADDHVTEARREANAVLSDARRKAEEATGQARAAADALERDARLRHQEALASLDAKRAAALKHIEELTGFQREYRAQLKAHVDSQLRDLDGRGQSLEATDAAR